MLITKNFLTCIGLKDLTREQMDMLGVEKNPRKGWRKRLVGTVITVETVKKLVASMPNSQIKDVEEFLNKRKEALAIQEARNVERKEKIAEFVAGGSKSNNRKNRVAWGKSR